MKIIFTLLTLSALVVSSAAYAEHRWRDDRHHEQENWSHQDDSYRQEGRWHEREDRLFHRHPDLRHGHTHLFGALPHHHHGNLLHFEHEQHDRNDEHHKNWHGEHLR